MRAISQGACLLFAVVAAGCAVEGAEAAPATETTAATPVVSAPAPPPMTSASARPEAVVNASAAPVAAPSPCPSAMVFIPAGRLSTMERGADVDVAGFCIDKTEVSVADFRACVAADRCARQCASKASCPDVPTRTEWGNPDEDGAVSRLCNGRYEGRDDHPVNCVSFAEAEAYCKARGARLPSGDEWEWASKSGPEKKVSPWGTPIVKDEICWGKPKKRNATCARGSHPKDLTAQGIEQMGGSVSEWVTPPARNKNATSVTWVYGASWYAIDDGYARAALGGVQMPARRAETVGFRCAVDAK